MNTERDALHRLDTLPKTGHGKRAFVNVRHIFPKAIASAALTTAAMVVLAAYKAGLKTSTQRLVTVTELIPTQTGIFRRKVEKDIEQDRLKEPVLVWSRRGKLYILDGHHRAATALLVGCRKLDANVITGAT